KGQATETARLELTRHLTEYADGWKPAGGKLTPGEKDQPAIYRAKPGPGRIAGIRVARVPDPAKKLATAPTWQVSFSKQAPGAKETKLAPLYGRADVDMPIHFRSTNPIQGLVDGWRMPAQGVHVAEWLFAEPVVLAGDDELILRINGPLGGTILVGTTPIASIELPTPKTVKLTDTIVALSMPRPTPKGAEVIQNWKQILELNGGQAWTQVSVATEPIRTRLLPRGNWQDESGPIVEPATPGFLPPIANPSGKRLNRLDLANWITTPSHPLTARVFANRTWKLFFGTGLSSVLEDVGAQGEAPSHPELLDDLAAEFAKNWDVKKLVRRIVLSQTYQQISTFRAEHREADPANRLLAGQNPRRLDAEFVRDNALAVAGLLNRDLHGPSVKPYQPEGYYANLQFPDRKYIPDTDERRHRRGVYMHWQRTFLHPMLANFDAPSREECTANRIVANTPQQALTLLNDPVFVEAARALGRWAEAQPVDEAARVQAIVERVLARPATERELKSLASFLKLQRAEYTKNAADVPKLVGQPGATAEAAAWVSLARVVLNLHETITRY
ncbi:MAG: DUF1553 domain-containing protein, partial [Gemmataceae bacterium]